MLFKNSYTYLLCICQFTSKFVTNFFIPTHMYYQGILIGFLSFVIIGVFHPIVMKAEFYCGKKSWKWFLVLGIVFCVVALFIPSVFWSALAGLVGFSSLWSITEVIEQEERVQKGWFPPNPKRAGKLEIREETPKDYNSIRRINERAFGQLDEAFLVEKLRSKPHFERAISLVAVKSNIVVGHILFFPVMIVSPEGKVSEVLSLVPLAVFPEFQKQGIGKALLDKGLKLAEEKGYSSVLVPGAASFYSRFEFREASVFGISSTIGWKGEILQIKELKEGALSDVNGKVEYPKEFQIFI